MTERRDSSRRTAGRFGLVTAALAAAALATALAVLGGCGKKENQAELPPAETIETGQQAAPDTTVGGGMEGRGALGVENAPAAVPGAVDRSETTRLPTGNETPAGSGAAETGASQPAARTTQPPPAPAETPAARTTPTGAYSLQVGSFRELRYAEARISALGDAGITASLEEAEVRGQTYYRVIVPGLRSRDEAESLGLRIQNDLGFETLVRKD